MTTIQLTIPDEVAAALVRVAESQGRSAEEIAVEAIQKQLDPFARLDGLMAPSYAAMEGAAITEDEAVEHFERVKHELRQARRAVDE
jgi:predicted transcriptional regulator